MSQGRCYYLYLIECQNGAYYTGYTTDIVRRYQEHCQGSKKCKYTRAYPPKRLAAYWQLQASLSAVLKLEYALKKCSKAQKQALAAKPSDLPMLLDKFRFKTEINSIFSI